MAINIKDPATEQIVRELAELTGGNITDAVRAAAEALLEVKKAERGERAKARRKAAQAILDEVDKLPVYDDRPWREIVDDQLDGL